MPATLIVSDLHLGRPEDDQPRAEQLRPLIAHPGLDTLIVNGDAAETANPAYQSAAIDELSRLSAMCDERDVRLILLAGNHDADLTDTRYLHLADDRVLITHGDAFHPGIAPWSERARHMHRETVRAHARLPASHRDDLHTRLAISSWVAEREFKGDFGDTHDKHESSLLTNPLRIAQVLHYWAIVPGLAGEFVERYAPDVRVLVFGHSHMPGVWRRGGRVIVNTGSFSFPRLPHAVLTHDDATFAYHRVVRRRDGYTLDPTPRITLDPARRRP
ncbi:MAG: metallophosphoesterase [Planctomycetota bacterium]